jgi:hypothetical protein
METAIFAFDDFSWDISWDMIETMKPAFAPRMECDLKEAKIE